MSDEPDAGTPDFPVAFAGTFSTCRASALKFTNDFAQCLSSPPKVCSYRLSYGMHCYCYHPDRLEIIKRTSAERAAGNGK